MLPGNSHDPEPQMLEVWPPKGAPPDAAHQIVEALGHGIRHLVDYIVGNVLFMTFECLQKTIKQGDVERTNVPYPGIKALYGGGYGLRPVENMMELLAQKIGRFQLRVPRKCGVQIVQLGIGEAMILLV